MVGGSICECIRKQTIIKRVRLRSRREYDLASSSLCRAINTMSDRVDRKYETVLSQIEKQGDTDYKTRFMLAKKVFEHTAAYDALIANYFYSQSEDQSLPNQYTISFEKSSEMRYGENSHQKATFYQSVIPVPGSLSKAEQINGKELS